MCSPDSSSPRCLICGHRPTISPLPLWCTRGNCTGNACRGWPRTSGPARCHPWVCGCTPGKGRSSCHWRGPPGATPSRAARCRPRHPPLTIGVRPPAPFRTLSSFPSHPSLVVCPSLLRPAVPWARSCVFLDSLSLSLSLSLAPPLSRKGAPHAGRHVGGTARCANPRPPGACLFPPHSPSQRCLVCQGPARSCGAGADALAFGRLPSRPLSCQPPPGRIHPPAPDPSVRLLLLDSGKVLLLKVVEVGEDVLMWLFGLSPCPVLLGGVLVGHAAVRHGRLAGLIPRGGNAARTSSLWGRPSRGPPGVKRPVLPPHGPFPTLLADAQGSSMTSLPVQRRGGGGGGWSLPPGPPGPLAPGGSLAANHPRGLGAPLDGGCADLPDAGHLGGPRGEGAAGSHVGVAVLPRGGPSARCGGGGSGLMAAGHRGGPATAVCGGGSSFTGSRS